MSAGGGKGGGGAASLHDYYGSVVGLLGWGPASQLNAVLIDGKEVWSAEVPILRSESANPFVFDVPKYGRCHFYWGSDDQVNADPDEIEICTIRSIEPPASGIYPLHVWRARFGTERLSFVTGDRAYIVQRSSLTWFEWRGLPSRALGGMPSVQLKLIPATNSESVLIADATAKTLDLRDQSAENLIGGLYDGQTALQIETSALDDRVTALENPPPP